MKRLLGVLGWVTPNDVDSDWGDRPPVRPSERRTSPRHLASPNEANMGWWVGDEFHSVAAHFRDISSGGALILTREDAPQQACLDRSCQARRNTLVPGESRPGEGDFGRLDRGWSGVPFTLQLRSLRRCGPKRLLGVKTSWPSMSLGIPAILTLCPHKLLPLLWSLGFASPHVPGNGRKS